MSLAQQHEGRRKQYATNMRNRTIYFFRNRNLSRGHDFYLAVLKQ